MPEGGEIRQVAEQLQHWLREGPELCRRLLDRVRALQEQVEAGKSEVERLRLEIEASQQANEQLGRELTAMRSENERLREEGDEWTTLVGTVNQATHRMNELILRLRGSREQKP